MTFVRKKRAKNVDEIDTWWYEEYIVFKKSTRTDGHDKNTENM